MYKGYNERMKMNEVNNVQNGIAKKLRTLRAEANKSQLQVATDLGISQQTYSKYENQESNIDSATIVKICNLYGITADYLLGIEKEERRSSGNISCVLQLTDEQIEMLAKEIGKAKNNK